MRIPVIALLLCSTPAYAQTQVVQEPDRVVVKKKTIIEFGSGVIDGTFAQPEGSYTLVAPRPGFPNLIKLRKDFLPELERSTDRM
jgi:hypothetical protein